MDEQTFFSPGFTILVDTREQAGFSFRNMKADKNQGGGTVIVRTKSEGLKTGDYSIDGLQQQFSIERKSMEDLFNCVGNDRKRFAGEGGQLHRLNDLDTGHIMIEADWMHIQKSIQSTGLDPKTISSSVAAWTLKYYPNVHWWFMPGKRAAELMTFRLMSYYWKMQKELGVV